MKSRQRLMSVVVATLAVLAVPLSASAKNHNNNYTSYRAPSVSSTRAFNAQANSFTAFKSAPSTSSFFHQAASTNGFFGAHAARNAFFNSTAVNTPAHYYGTTAWNSGVTPVYNNYATTTPGYVAPVRPVYYGGYSGYPTTYAAPYGGYSAPYAGYAAPVAGYAAPMTGYAAPYAYGGGGPCGNPYKAEKHQYNFTKLMNERQNLNSEIAQSRSYGNYSNAHRLNTQLEYVNEKLGEFHNTCGAAAGYMPAAPAMMAAPTPYYGNGYGYNGYSNYGGYNGYGAPYGGGGLTSMLPLLGNFIH
jgi:hypothetical protein